jgi:hypothetical protein
MNSKYLYINGALLATLLFSIVMATGMGYLQISAIEVLQVISNKLFFSPLPHDLNQVFPFNAVVQ